MSKLSKVSDKLMGLTISELTQAQNMIHEIKSMNAKAALSVGANVFVVQKTKKLLRCFLTMVVDQQV